MNSNLLYEGDYYAWHQYRPKGRTPIGAAKVRVNRVRKTRTYDGPNRRTRVEITIIEPNGMRWYKEGRTLSVPAREIIDTWDSYKDEEALLIAERDRRNIEQRRREIRSSILQTYLAEGLRTKGIDSTRVMINDAWVNIPSRDVLAWLGITDEAIDEAVKRALGPQVADDDEPDFLSLINGG